MPTKRTLPERSPAPAASAVQPAPATTELALATAALLDAKQATDILILDVSASLAITDYFVLSTVRTTRQAHAIARELDLLVKQRTGQRRRNPDALESEGSAWVLLDYNDLVVHLFLADARAFYGLETLWADAPRLPFVPTARPAEAEVEPARPVRPDRTRFRILPETPTGDGDRS